MNETTQGTGMLEDELAGTHPRKRVFLDAAVVEESAGLTREFHAARKHPANPVVTRDRSWEGWGPYVYGTVLRDGGVLRMWYSCIGYGAQDVPSCVCYAESEDGLEWRKPELGLVEFRDSRANNIVAAGKLGMPSVIRTRNPESAKKTWSIHYWGGENGACVAYSADGLAFDWDGPSSRQKLFQTSDVVNFFWDPYKNRYTSTYKVSNRRNRSAGLALSDNGVDWTKPVEGAVFGADDLDPDATQVYGMPVFPYQGLYVGLPWIYHARFYKYGSYSVAKLHEAQKDSPRTADVQMSWSWNLISWNRPPAREPFIALGEPGEFDCGQIYTARAPVVVGDELFFYYGACDEVHDEHNTTCAIGIATLRLDGFCSMRAAGEEGWFISRRELFRTPRIAINAKCAASGYVAAEIVDRDNNVLPGFSRDECNVFDSDAVAGEISWRTESFAPELVEPDKKIRFYLKNADIYSYVPVDAWDHEAE